MGTGTALIVIIVIVVLVLFYIAAVDSKRQKQARQIEQDYYELNYKHANEGLDALSYEEAKKHLEVLEKNYPGDAAISSRLSRKVYKDDMRDLRQWTNTLKREEKADWKYTMQFTLDRFKQNYKAAKYITLDDSDKVKTYVKRCLESWDTYFNTDPPNMTIDPKEHFIKSMGDEYDPCMLNRGTLADQLNTYIEKAAPLQQKKIDFYKEVRRILRENGEMPRSTLLQMPFDGYSQYEVKICYQAMVKTKRVKEEKRSNRYIVSLNAKQGGTHGHQALQ